jgi:hypothetical protein
MEEIEAMTVPSLPVMWYQMINQVQITLIRAR